jgi:hypothetical protein
MGNRWLGAIRIPCYSVGRIIGISEKSVLRLEGIIEKVAMVVDDTVACEKGKLLV